MPLSSETFLSTSTGKFPTIASKFQHSIKLYMQINQNRAKNVDPLLNGSRDLVAKNMEKTEVYNALFVLIFTG